MAEKSKLIEIISGHLLIIISSLAYSTAWVMIYRSVLSGLADTLVMVTILLGMTGAGLIVWGLGKIPLTGSIHFKLWYIFLGCFILFLLTYFITTHAFKRQLTSEIFFIFIWLTLESCCIYVLFYGRQISFLQTLIASLLILIALIIGIICYTIHYTLPDFPRFINGLIPYFVYSFTMLIITFFMIFHQTKHTVSHLS